MSFTKTGEAPIEKVFCSCGAELQNGVCPMCAAKKKEKPQEEETKECSK